MKGKDTERGSMAWKCKAGTMQASVCSETRYSHEVVTIEMVTGPATNYVGLLDGNHVGTSYWHLKSGQSHR